MVLGVKEVIKTIMKRKRFQLEQRAYELRKKENKSTRIIIGTKLQLECREKGSSSRWRAVTDWARTDFISGLRKWKSVYCIQAMWFIIVNMPGNGMNLAHIIIETTMNWIPTMFVLVEYIYFCTGGNTGKPDKKFFFIFYITLEFFKCEVCIDMVR